MPRYDHMVMLAKTETSYGVDAAPTALANAMVLQQVEITPMEADRVEQPRVTAYDKANNVLTTAERLSLTGTLDAAASGTLGKAPASSPLLRACGLSETIVTSTAVEYRPVSRNHESASLYHYIDGSLHKGFGARGDLTYSVTAKGIPTLRCAMQGLWVEPGAAALPTADYSAFKDATVADFLGAPLFRIGGVDVPMQSFNFSMGNQVTHRELVGKREVRILGRNPRVTVVIEAPASLAQNYFAMAKAKATTTIALALNSAPGFVIGWDAFKARVLPPSFVNDNGVQMLSIEFVLLPTVGDDEFFFTFR